MSDVHDELAALAQSLQKTVQRRGRLGARRLPPGSPAPSQSETQATPAVAAEPTPQPVSAQPVDSVELPPQPAPAATPLSQAALAAACPDMKQLAGAAGRCQACALHQGRQTAVFADGAPGRDGILFLGESPSGDDNRSGIPFSGASGQLLTDIIQKGMGLDRQAVTITHLVKCPTPADRAPSDEEISLCAPWFQRQLELGAPKVLIPLGQGPANFLLGTKSSLAELRNRSYERLGRQIIPTLDPAQLLQDPAKKRDCWTDIQRAMAAAGIEKRV